MTRYCMNPGTGMNTFRRLYFENATDGDMAVDALKALYDVANFIFRVTPIKKRRKFDYGKR